MKWLILLSFTFLGCGGTSAENNAAKANFKIGNGSLAVPVRYLLSEVPDASSAADLGDEVNLKIPLSDLGLEAESSDSLTHNVILLISPLSNHYAAYAESPDALAAWRGRGLYKERKIYFDAAVGLFRIEPGSGNGKIWHYFKTSPDADYSKNGSWISGCMVGPLEKEKIDLSNAICDSTVKLGGMQIELSFSGKSIRDADRIKQSVIDLAKTWIIETRQPRL